MADTNGININQIKSFVDKFFKMFGNFVDGYSTTNSKVSNQKGGVSCTFILSPKEGLGNKDDVAVKLTATNVGSACKDYLNCIDNLNFDNLVKDAKYRNIFMKLTSGTNPSDALIYNDVDGNLCGDISLDAIINRGLGILGFNLENSNPQHIINSPEFKLWYDMAFNKLKYNLECETEVHDKGSVTNQKLIDLPKWVFKYIDFINGKEEVNETSKDIEDLQPIEGKDDEGSNTSLNAVNALTMVIPILDAIQKQLRTLYQDKLNSEDSLQKLQQNMDAGKNKQPEDTDENEAEEDMEQQLDNLGETDASKHITVKLHKILGSIDLMGLESNYPAPETLDDLDDIVYQDEFLDALGDEPQSFAIDVDADGYDIEPCENCIIDPCDSLGQVLKQGITMYRNLYIIHWMAKGNDMMKTHLLTEDMYSELIQEIDTIGELMVEKCGTVISPDFTCGCVEVRPYEFQESLDILNKLIQDYIDMIDYAYPNQTSDVQSTLDEWLRYWNKQMNYFVKGQEE